MQRQNRAARSGGRRLPPIDDGSNNKLSCRDAFLTALFASVLLTSCQWPEGSLPEKSNPSNTIRLFAAASTMDIVTETCQRFTNETGIAVETSFAASSAQANMLIQGVSADLFLSASVPWCEAVAKEFPNSEMVKLLGNRLVLIVPKDSNSKIQSIADLNNSEIRKIAIADYQAVPAGVYAKQAIDSAGLWDTLSEKLVGTLDVRQALTMVENRIVDCGFVYQTDALSSQNVRIVSEVTGHDPVVYPLLLLPDASANGRVLFEFLQSATARTVFERHGFQVLPVPSAAETLVK